MVQVPLTFYMKLATLPLPGVRHTIDPRDLSCLATSRSFANTIFYLSVLRDARVLAGDSRVSDRQTHLAEGWTFFEAIRPQVAAASPEAAALVEEAFTRSAEEAFPADLTEDVYAALNEPAVLEALGIPEKFQFTSPAQ